MYLILWCAIAAAALLLAPTTVQACHDDYDLRTMDYTTATVTIGLTGVTQYTFNGSCSTSGSHHNPTPYGFSFSASGTWDPGNKQAQERVNGQPGWQVQTTWSCPTDPWLQQFNHACTQVSFSGTEGAPVLASTAPFSATQAPVEQLLEQRKKAMPGPPALPPRDVKAVIRSPLPSGGRAHISWGIPADQTSMHRTVAWLQVERRPADQNVAWFPASAKLSATATGHADPDPLPTKTEYRVCAGNVSGKTCSPPVLAVADVAERLSVRREGVADTILAQQVRDALAQKLPSLAPKIQVDARHGVVTLTGNVPTPASKLEVGKVTADVHGVSQVENRLDVESAAAPPISTQSPLGTGTGVGTKGLRRNP